MNLDQLAEICAFGTSEQIANAIRLFEEFPLDVLNTLCRYCTHSYDVNPLIYELTRTMIPVDAFVRIIRGVISSLAQNTNMEIDEILELIDSMIKIIEPLVGFDNVMDTLNYAYGRAIRSNNQDLARELRNKYRL